MGLQQRGLYSHQETKSRQHRTSGEHWRQDRATPEKLRARKEVGKLESRQRGAEISDQGPTREPGTTQEPGAAWELGTNWERTGNVEATRERPRERPGTTGNVGATENRGH